MRKRSSSFSSFASLSLFESKNAEKNWEKLNELEKNRRRLLRKTDKSSLRILFSYEGTFWKIMLGNPILWFCIVIYVGVRLFDNWGVPVPRIEGGQVSAVGALMTFFIVYFHVQYSNRFDMLYLSSTACQGRIFDVSLIAKASLPFNRAVRLLRYMNAAHAAAYVGLSETYSTDEFFATLNKKFCLLTSQEFERLKDIDSGGYGGSTCREAIAWCMLDVNDALCAGCISEYTAQDLRQKLMDFRGSIATMYDLDDQPILFFYIHFIHFLSAVYLPLLSLSVASAVGSNNEEQDASAGVQWACDILGLVVVLLQSIFVIGIRVLAQKMRDPYGDELEDLSVLTYVIDAYHGSMRVLNCEQRGPLDSRAEQRLTDHRESIGTAWACDSANFFLGGSSHHERRLFTMAEEEKPAFGATGSRPSAGLDLRRLSPATTDEADSSSSASFSEEVADIEQAPSNRMILSASFGEEAVDIGGQAPSHRMFM